MDYRFKRSSEIYVIKDGVGYGISALSDFTLSQTISEKTINRRNLFNRYSPKQIINRSRNVGTGSITMYFTNNCPTLAMLLDSLDFSYDYNKGFKHSNIYSNVPKYVTLFIRDINSTESISLPKVYITNMDVQCSPTNISRITFGFSFNEYNEEGPLGYLIPAVDPDYPKPSYIDFRALNRQIYSVKSAAFTVTRNLHWLSEGATQFNLKEITSFDRPVVTDFDITSLVTANDNSGTSNFKHLVPYNTDVIVGNNAFYLSLPNARVTTRKEPAEVFVINFDIKHQSLSPVHIGGTYNGYIN